MNKKFERICQMSQAALKKYVERELKYTHNDITVGDGFVFAKGTFPVLLLAHMDTVHKHLPNVICYDPEKDRMSSPTGIGGDDRCGIYMILDIVRRYNCSVLFCEDEEVGGIGARKFIETDLAKELEFNYAIELDRRGRNDAVFYDCENDDFEDFITKEFYKTSWGSFSDISVVAPALGCAAVNLSCGYYNAHTNEEYVVLSEMEKGIEEVCKILETTTEEDKFEYVESTYSKWYRTGYSSGSNSVYKGNSYFGSYSSSWYDDYDCDSYSNYYLIEYFDECGKTNWFETYAVSEAEAVGRLLMWYPELCYHNVIDVMVDKPYGGK